MSKHYKALTKLKNPVPPPEVVELFGYVDVARVHQFLDGYRPRNKAPVQLGNKSIWSLCPNNKSGYRRKAATYDRNVCCTNSAPTFVAYNRFGVRVMCLPQTTIHTNCIFR